MKRQKKILEVINKLDRTGKNGKWYEAYFKKIGKKGFEEYIQRLRDGGEIHLVLPLGSKPLDIEDYDKIAKSLGISLFNRVYLVDEEGEYMPAQEFLTGYVPVKVTKQTNEYAFSSAKHQKSRNAITNNRTGDSKAASITQPEMNIFANLGAKNLLDEIANGRVSHNADTSERMILESGLYSLGALDSLRKESGALGHVKALFKGMHLNLETSRNIKRIRND